MKCDKCFFCVKIGKGIYADFPVKYCKYFKTYKLPFVMTQDHGRRTYMPSLVQQIVMAHFKDLSDRTLKVIADDERFQADMSLWGDTCDMVDWKNFYQILREWQLESGSTDCPWK